jgi:tripartite-type tricarboxylate transporter receptor subunit TctC
MQSLHRLLGTAIVIVAAAVSAPTGRAQEAYPTRTITLTHGFGAGGNGDTISRIVAEPLSRRLGQQVIVEARPGAGGNIASDRAAKAAADGYTLIMLTGGHAVSGALYKKLPFDPVDDFQMLSTVGYLAFLIAVRADSPHKTLADLIAAAKAAPGKLTFSSVGVGSTQHLGGELLAAMAGIKLTHVPYRGGNAPMTDLLGGRLDLSVDSITIIGPQLAAGKVRALGVTSPTPWWSHPDIPPVATTVKGYDVRTWLGVAAPKSMPQPIMQKLNTELRALLAEPATQERLKKLGMDVRASSPDEMRTLVASQIATWKKVIAEAKIPQQ